MEKIDFIAIGDITTDTFIRLTDAHVHCDIDNTNCTISMNWGDKIPYEFAVAVHGVGNAANAAVSASRLGINAGFLSWTGKDEGGDANIEALTKDGVDTSLVTQIEGITSNHDFVLWFGNERTILIKHSAFPYSIPDHLPEPRYIYLSSLGDPSGNTHHALVAWLTKHPETKLLFQPGQEIGMGREKLADVYKAAYLCVCNKEEAERILGYDTPQTPAVLLDALRAIGPDIAIITDGPNGAYASDGTASYVVPMYPDPTEPYERTGAGDAFASAVASALVLGKPLNEALLWGPVNSMSVVQKIGAQEGLLTRERLEALLLEAPADYQLKTL